MIKKTFYDNIKKGPHLPPKSDKYLKLFDFDRSLITYVDNDCVPPTTEDKKQSKSILYFP